MDMPIIIGIVIFAAFILLGIIKRVIKTIVGLILIAALIGGGLYIYNTYPNEIKDATNAINQLKDSTTVMDYLRVDEDNNYYVYVESRDSSDNIIYPKGKVFDYPGVDITIDKITKIANGDLSGFKRQYYKIDKKGNPIVPRGITSPRKFLQPKLSK